MVPCLLFSMQAHDIIKSNAGGVITVAMTIQGGIKEVELSGFKSIKSETLSLNNLNIFIGANGSGKTNFISFFQMLQYYLSSPGGLSEYIGRNGGAEYLLHFGAKTTSTIGARITINTENGENEYCVELGTALGDSLFFKDERITYTWHESNGKATPIPLGSGVKTSRLLLN